VDRARVKILLRSLAQKYRAISAIGGPLKDIYAELAEAIDVAMEELERE